MRFPHPALLVVVVFALAAAFTPEAVAVSVGADKAAVIEELGKPASTAVRGDREILSYPKGVRITLVNGQVESAQGITLGVGEMTEPATTTPPPAKPSPSEAPEEVAEEDAAEPAPAAKGPAPQPATSLPSVAGKSSPAPGAAVAQPAHQEESTGEEGESYSDELESLPLVGLALFLGIHFLATLGGLKLAFKVWTMDSLFTGMLAIAAIDLVLHGIFVALGPATGGFTTMPAVENGIPGLVMIFTIRHFCFNKNLSDAIQTAGVVKVAVALLKMFGAMSLLGSVLG